ncbi:MAG: tyrosine-type recombinase/integrase [Spirochaetota bacterium]
MPKENPYKNLFFLRRRKDRNNIYYIRFAHTPTRWYSSQTANKDAAVAWAYDYLEAPPDGEPQKQAAAQVGAITLRKFADGFFMQDSQNWIRRQNARNKTFGAVHLTNSEGHLQNYILPRFGDRAIRSLKIREIENFILEIKGKSDNTKNKILHTFRIVLQEAYEQELIESNPARQVRPIIERNQRREIFSDEEIQKLFPSETAVILSVWPDYSWYLYFRVMLAGGLRPGEVSALQWQDFLPSSGGLSITKSVENRTRRIKGLKTENNGKAYKPVILDEETLERLIRYMEQRKKSEAGMIFAVPATGSIICADTANKIFRYALKRAGIEAQGRTQYCLRHTFQTRILQKLSREVVADFMGHTHYRAGYDHRSAEEMLGQYAQYRDMLKIV